MDDLTMWSLIVGTALPPLISVVQQPQWDNRLRSIVTAVICVIAGGVTAYLASDLEGKTWISSALIVVVAAMTTYRNFWKTTGVSPTIEAATSTRKVA